MANTGQGIEPMDVDSCSDHEMGDSVDEVNQDDSRAKTTNRDSAQNITHSSTTNVSASGVQPKRTRLNISVYTPKEPKTTCDQTEPAQPLSDLDGRNQTSTGSFTLEQREPEAPTIGMPGSSKSAEEQEDKSVSEVNSVTTAVARNDEGIISISKEQTVTRLDDKAEPAQLLNTDRRSRTSTGIIVLEPHVQRSTIQMSSESKSTVEKEEKVLSNVNSGTINAGGLRKNDLSGAGCHPEQETLVNDKKVEFVRNVGCTVSESNSLPLGSPQERLLHDFSNDNESDDEVFHDLDEGTGQTGQECDSFSDIEDLITSLKEFKPHKWTPSSSSARRLFVGNSGSWYEGDVDGRNMSGLGTLYSSDKRQFIRGMWVDNKLLDLQSCQFTDQGSDEWTIYLRKQVNSYLLTFDEDEFVGRAQMRYVGNFIHADFTASFRLIKLSFFRNLTVTKVIEDRLQSNRQSDLNEFEKVLRTVVSDAANSTHFAVVLITLRKYLKDNSAKVILTSMINNKEIPNVLRNAAKSLLVSESNLSNRRLELLKFSRDTRPPKLEVQSVIHTVYTEAINRHRQTLVDKCPSSLPSLITNIWELPPDRIIYVSKPDIELFHHLASLTKEHHLLSFFNEMHLGLFEKLRRINSSSRPNVVMPLSNPVYGFLFKSFLEMISEITFRAENCSVSTMFFQERGKWKLVDEICWVQDTKLNKNSLVLQSLECQYRFIFQLLRHFEPKYYSVDKNFEYEYKVLNKEDSDDSWWKKQFKKLKNRITRKSNLIDIPQDRQVWLYILDHTISQALTQNASDHKSCLDLFRPVLDGHITFISGCPTNSYESFRVVTHNILMFMIQAIPHFQKTEKLSEQDLIILEKQMQYITTVSAGMKSDSQASSDFRNLIDEYNRYWSLRHLVTVDDSLNPGNLVSQIQEIHETLLRLVEASLEKTVHVSTLVKYFRELNDFIEDFKDIDFPSNWFIKSSSSRTGVIEKVDNKIASEAMCSYKVIDLKRFIEEFNDGCQPKHHIIQIVRRLLECAIESLSINWISTGEQSVAQMEGTGALLGAIRSSFLYLKEQPDYRDFELFTNESVQPFLQVVSSCHVLEEFKIRVNVVKESFWYIRKMDEIGIDKALELYNKINRGSLNSEKLKQCYDRYLLEYNEYVGKTKSKSVVDGVNFVIECMRNNKADYKELTNWDKDFKAEVLPKMLAGLSAVWSLLVSKDVSSSGKFLKPHCIQILCVMRLLSMDNSSQGVEHHLSQVLTGQGKSVILGLLSAILAFTGYKVRVLCYSEYLAKRDENDFKEFFNILELSQCISYGTFGDMANEFVNPIFKGESVSLRKLVESMVLEHRSLETLGSPSSDANKTVLLIDEVDVFFSEHYYGNTYNSCVSCKIPGLPTIQEQIWKTAHGSNYEQNALYRLIQEFIDDGVKSGDEDLREYNKFRLKSGKILLLDRNNEGDLVSEEFTNRSLLEKHLMAMVEQAILVSKGTTRNWFINHFKIIDGKICCLDFRDGTYSSNWYYNYYNTFNYLRLKEVDFDHTNFLNYGYILLETGNISYAKLPEEFPLILGVSGTVSNLSDHENEAIKSYNINSFSILPSFFGDSNLKFNKVDNFCILDSEKDWGSKIFDQINTVLQAYRSVLVFFNTDVELGCFQQDYGNKFDRLNVLTENTNGHLKSKYIDEAGISSAVTLCTRGMGRGVDYKSSMAVEKKGGVHVIQTFFSLDVKEETQIKGRTARKDNKGSYELILCKEHLIAAKLLTGTASDTCDYSSIHQTRLELMKVKGAKNAERIRKSEKNHKLTMEFFGIGATRK